MNVKTYMTGFWSLNSKFQKFLLMDLLG